MRGGSRIPSEIAKPSLCNNASLTWDELEEKPHFYQSLKKNLFFKTLAFKRLPKSSFLLKYLMQAFVVLKNPGPSWICSFLTLVPIRQLASNKTQRHPSFSFSTNTKNYLFFLMRFSFSLRMTKTNKWFILFVRSWQRCTNLHLGRMSLKKVKTFLTTNIIHLHRHAKEKCFSCTAPQWN